MMGGNAKTTEFLKECLADALIKLLRKKPIEKIAVPEIVTAAQDELFSKLFKQTRCDYL